MLKKVMIITMVLITGISAAACSPGSDETKLSGTVSIDGSGTVYPLMANIAEEYMLNVRPEVSVEVGRAGSSAGFKKFIPGETDLSDASRAIKDEEIAQLQAEGLEIGRASCRERV